jgi:hypothetical protein
MMWREVPATQLVAGAVMLTNPKDGGGCPMVRTVESVIQTPTGFVLVRFEGRGPLLEVTEGAVVWARLPDAVKP